MAMGAPGSLGRYAGMPTLHEPLQPLLVSVKEAAALYGISYRHMVNLLDAGEIPSLKLGRRRMVSYGALVEHIDRRLKATG
jgi:excisionase family DNA binding protein